jgi:hypothetical protein
MWSYWPAVLGFLIVAFTLREVYQDLFHPSSTGSLSDFVASTTFNMFRHVPRFLSEAGPLAIVLVIFIWAASVCVGFALIYWAMPPGSFKIQAGQPPTAFWQMVYFSLEVLTTLGLGDYAPVPIWLRLLVTFEALVGFGVLTASVSSIILVHSALARLRTLARRISTVRRVEDEMKFSFDAHDAQQILAEFSASVIRTRVDPISRCLLLLFGPGSCIVAAGFAVSRSACRARVGSAQEGRNSEIGCTPPDLAAGFGTGSARQICQFSY